VFSMIQTFETLLRTWNIEGRSVRPDHRMVAHSGFLTFARKVEAGFVSMGVTEPEDSASHEEHEP
jgi:tRNA (adenine57-N1/adenine58-N1)-methyltransferase